MSHCLHNLEIVNPHWNENTKLGRSNLNGWRIVYGTKTGYPDDYKILIPCGHCLGCLRDKATQWRVRLLHEHLYGNHKNCICLTLTIAPGFYDQFQNRKGMAAAMRAFIDRLRYYVVGRKSPKRFFVSELGEQRGRLHFHGFIWDINVPERELRRAWKYGFICAKPLRSARQLSYATKYITKPAVAFHKPTIFVSPGLGIGYLNQKEWIKWHHAGNADTNINVCVRFDHFVYAMPRYYRDKVFTDTEISDFKVLLSDPERPFEKVFNRTSYDAPVPYLTARKKVYETSLRSGKSRAVKPEPFRLPDIVDDGSFDDPLYPDFPVPDDLTPF
ncbi:MAG: replication initiator protein [Chaetfec virus UA24_2329]|nr:MAG: replication initiator protein [Chaetfec virus UA24_2329]